MTDRNALNLKEAGLTTKEAGAEWMKNYFRIVQDCSAKTADCFAAGHYKRLNGSAIDIFDYTNVNAYVLASGAAVYVSPRADGRITFFMDINGKKGPNIIGRDVFAVMIYNNGVMDDSGEIAVTDGPLTKEQRDTLFEEHCKKGNGGYWWGCFGKILNDNWQMTY